MRGEIYITILSRQWNAFHVTSNESFFRRICVQHSDVNKIHKMGAHQI